MDLGLYIGYWGARGALDVDRVLEAERLGYRSVWAAEAWGSDAVTVLSWIGARTETIDVGSAIMQMPARTPAMTAMTAVTLSELTGGRFRLGLGPSGPQVAEGWHGVPFGRPLTATREYVSIVRRIIAREEPLTHAGDQYRIPYDGPDATGLGKPLKLITRARYPVPVYLASLGPRMVRLAAEIADGWLPVLFSPGHFKTVHGSNLNEGFAAAGDPAKREGFDIAPQVPIAIDDDIEAARDRIRPQLAFYVGGMGARGRNFYNDVVCRYGYEEEAARIQDLYLAGKRKEATAAVPNGLVDDVSLVGPPAAVAEGLERFRAAGVTSLLLNDPDVATLRATVDLI